MPARPPHNSEAPVLCPTCSTSLKTLVSAVQDMPQLDDLFLCGKCATLSRFTRAGLFALTQEEKDLLDEDEKSDLAFATRNILARAAYEAQQKET